MKICVIGSGISGLSVANMLHHKHEVTLYEKEKQIGGLIKCSREEGNLFHRVGGHVFNSKNKEVLDWFWSFFNEDEFTATTRKAKIFMNHQYLGYPIENNIYKLPKSTVDKIITELLEQQTTTTNYMNFEEFLRGNFGNTLYDIYFKPYNEKIWNTDLKQVPLDWLEGKLPMPNIKEILLSNILREEESSMVHSSFYYPLKGGSQFIVDRLSEALNIVSNTAITSIEKTGNGWQVDGAFFDCVIYTGDVRQLDKIISLPSTTLSKNLEQAHSFISNGTSNVLCYTEDKDISWLYFPESSFLPHRIIYTGNFSSTNNAANRKTCVVEFSGQHKKENIFKELKKMPGNLEPIAFNYEPNSYVVNSFDTKTIVNNLKQELEKDNFFLLGRFAEWEYYNMDKCIEAAFKLVEELS